MSLEEIKRQIEQLRRELHDERVRRDEWEKMYNQAIAGTIAPTQETTMKLIDAYTVQPNKIESGDIALFIVKAMIVRTGVYRLYRCRYPVASGSDEIPQGDRIINEREVCQALFPSLATVAEPDRY